MGGRAVRCTEMLSISPTNRFGMGLTGDGRTHTHTHKCRQPADHRCKTVVPPPPPSPPLYTKAAGVLDGGARPAPVFTRVRKTQSRGGGVVVCLVTISATIVCRCLIVCAHCARVCLPSAAAAGARARSAAIQGESRVAVGRANLIKISQPIIAFKATDRTRAPVYV